jgi:mannose-6-phosphate isomerase-like protein (cupin superfamily)
MATSLRVDDWTGTGYAPLVLERAWQAAVLNWEPAIDAGLMVEIERHARTAETFVLVAGRAVLLARTDDEAFAEAVMEPGRLYTVAAGAWHAVAASRDAKLLIVEDRDTHLGDTELRGLTVDEHASVASAELAEGVMRCPAGR